MRSPSPSVRRVAEGDAVWMECQLCGARAALDDTLPYINQTASFLTDHGCPEADEPAPLDAP